MSHAEVSLTFLLLGRPPFLHIILLAEEAQVNVVELQSIKEELRHFIVFLQFIIPSDPQILEVLHTLSIIELVALQSDPLQLCKLIIFIVIILFLLLDF